MNNFVMVDNDILALNLSGQAFKLYIILKSYCFSGKTCCFPSQETLSKRLNKSVRTVQRALKELSSAGLIKIKRRGSTSNVYELTLKSQPKDIKGENIHDKLNSIISLYGSKNNKNYNHKSKYRTNNYQSRKDYFNNFQQRKYDFDKLEKMLLGEAPVPEDLREILL